MNFKRFRLSTSQIILLSFLFTILIGSFLLALPISSSSGRAIPYIDALFTATTATCVTGLVTVPTVSTWSIFGQVVILLLIQIGGLGVITVVSGFMIMLKRRIGISNRLLIQDAFNLNSLSGLIAFVKKVIIGALFIEALGALAYMPVFIRDFGMKGIWISVFTSISAFCNAGIDIIAENSLVNYATNPLVNAVTIILIILGGIGFIVWWDIARVLKTAKKRGFKSFSSLTLHSKIALLVTAVLILLGTILIFVFEYNNPSTIKDYSLFDKIQVSVFQSVTTRTAGFATVNQENLTNSSAIISMLLMFIGGSPVGTAGGIKTVTLAVLCAAAYSTIKNKNEISLFGRSIPADAVKKSVAVIGMSFITMFISACALCFISNADSLDVFFEAVSATATVGLTRNFTSSLNTLCKAIVIITMYFGRIGPISLAIAFSTRKPTENIIKNPTEQISVG